MAKAKLNRITKKRDAPVDVALPQDEVKEEEDASMDTDDNLSDFDDSDREVQIALKEGILQKNGLNVLEAKPKPFINKTNELKQKLFQIKVNSPWINTLDIAVSNELTYEKSINDDFGREAFFYNQAQDAVRVAIPRLQKLGVSVFRPTDYYAEMAKSDEHMQKVRRRLIEIQKEKERGESAKRLRDEKRFAIKAQRAALEKKNLQKRKLMEAVKKHRKGMKAQLETMLSNATKLQTEEDDEDDTERRPKGRKGVMSRHKRDKKYGFGGQKKRSKRNDKESFENIIRNGKPNGRKRGAFGRKR
jgi:rRNA-processing protein EBP2